jgi:uncharacterized membrane protein (DUF106 family)
VTIVNEWLGLGFDVLLFPFRQLPPIVGLSFASLLTAMAMLMVFRATSDQRRIEQVKRAMVAALFEIRLFNDDLPALFRAQGEMLRQNANYLRLSLVPMLWMIVPLVLVVAQLEFRYGYSGLTPGQPVIVKAQLRHASAANAAASVAAGEVSSTPGPAAALEAPKAVRVLTSAVWFPATQEVIWQVTPEAPGEFVLNARIDGGTFTKTFDATDRVVRRSPVRASAGFLGQLLNPAERPLPEASGVTSISVAYPSRAIPILRWDVPWIFVYFALSMAFALLLRKPLGVTF